MKLRKFFNRLDLKTKALILGIAGGILIAAPIAVMAGYGPNGAERPTYDWLSSDPAIHNGPTDGPHFNSYINTDVYGDERAFFDTKACLAAGDACYTTGPVNGNPNALAFHDQMTVQPTADGKEYLVRAYVHNDANPSANGTNNTGVGVAKDTRVRVEIPKGIANGFTLQARINASNAIPREVYDTVDFKNDSQAFSVNFVPGSARMYNASLATSVDNFNNFIPVGDDLISSNGALIGAGSLNGIWPGCFDFAGYVVFRVKVQTPKLDVQKGVSKVEVPTKTDLSENITVNRGDTVSWRIDYKNNSAAVIDELTIRDQIPAGLTLVPGSITWSDNAHNFEVQPDNALSAGGGNVGSYAPGGSGVIRFRTKVTADPTVCEIVNKAFGRATGVPEIGDTAKITIANCNPTVAQFSCDLLDVTKGGNRTVTVSAFKTSQTNGATFKDASINWGDASGAQVVNPVVGKTHSYQTDGPFTITATARFSVNGKDQTATSTNCSKTVLFATTPTSTTVLPNTGPGDVFGIFSGVSIVGALLHRRFARG